VCSPFACVHLDADCYRQYSCVTGSFTGYCEDIASNTCSPTNCAIAGTTSTSTSTTTTSTSISVDGGGCVSGTDLMLLYNGTYIPVSNLKVGEVVYGYNTFNMKPTKERITYITTAYSQYLEVINGNINVTTEDQPFYIKNSTYTGWIKNPSIIKVGWYIYNPQNYSFVRVNSIKYTEGIYRVYDVYTNSTNDYVINGALADMKAA